LEVSSDGGAYLPYSSPIAFSDGHHTIQFKATDKAGNVTETPVQEFFVDTDAPTIDIPTSWESGKTIDYNIQDFGSGLSTLRIVIEDEDERYAKVAWNELVSGSQFNGEITWDGKFADGTLAPPGEYLVWIKATDQAGNERFGLGRVIVPEPNVVFSLFKSETTSESNPTPPRELTDPTDALTTSPLTTSSSSNSSASTGLSASFGGSTNPTKETDNQSLILASGITSSTTTTTNSNIVWGAGVAAMIGAAMAYALDEQRKRKEEEAQQRAQVQAEVDATNAALEASRQARREAAKIQGWLQGQAMLEAYIKAAEEQGATDAQIAELRQQGATQGFGAAIDSASDLNRDLFHLNTQNARMEAKMERIEAEEEAAWRAAQLELQRRAEEERKAAQEQQALADWRAGEKAEYVPPEPPSFWENPFGWFQATPLYTDVIEPYVVQPVQEAVTAITTVVEEKVVQPIQNIVAPVKNKPGKAPGLALIAPPAIEPPPWLKRLLDSGKKAVEDIAEWTIDTWEDGKQWVNTNVVQPAKEAVNKTVATVQNFVTTAVATAKNKYEEVKKDIQEKWEDIKQWVDTNVVQPHIHQAFRIGWNWLTEQGGGSSKDDRMLFGPDDQMTQDFMNSEGAQEAWQEFLDNGGVQPNGFYAVEVNFEAYYKGFIFKASWTETFVGGHIIYITNNGDGTATFTINNTTGLASLTHNPQSNYLNPSVETILGNLNNDPFGYMPKRLPTSFGDFMYNYSPSSIFTDRERSDPGLGGNMYQRYTWTVPIP
jgi:Txe/YoeB family toxin of Txe-Axe toxin-antitoxin module